jgi:AcrR family transcriptional regulator
LTERAAPPANAPHSTPKTAKGVLGQQRIKDAARRIFREFGYTNARVTDIAESAGFSNGAFYRYYTDKYDVMLALLNDLLELGSVAVRVPWDAKRPVESLEHATRLYLDFYEENADLFRVLVEAAQSFSEVEEMWSTVRAAAIARIERVLQRGKTQRVVRADLDAELAAGLLVAMTDHYAYLRFVVRRMPPQPLEHVSAQLAGVWSVGVFVNPTT